MSNTPPERGPRPPSGTEDAAARDFSAAPLVLSLDTATDARSVAVTRGARVLSLASEPAGASGASLVLAQIDAALREAAVGFGELGLLAVAVGPGSFTGLRAGLATVKAFAAVSGLPVAGVPTLHAVAAAAGASPCTVAAIPAGRGEIFAQLLRVAADGAVEELTPAAHVKPASLVEQVLEFSGEVRWVGGGAAAHIELIGREAERAGLDWRETSQREAVASPPARPGWSLVAPVESYAEQVAKLGLISLERGLTVRAESLRALYVRPSDAELKERCHA